MTRHRLLAQTALVTLWVASAAAQPDPARAIAEVSAAAEAQVRKGNISGVTIALVRDQQVVFVRGFGWADKRRKIAAGPQTVYRAGSISKLFTAVAAMQLAEQGRIDIDKPVSDFVPDFSITVPFEGAPPITLRQLMCHRSGLIRESPVGSYFDDGEPGMARTVASLASCVLVYPPATRTKYSNSGVTVVGHAVERVAGMPFEDYQRRYILDPLGMTNSSFLRTPPIRRRLATGYLPVAQPDGSFREIDAPGFELGTIAAGNLYTTAEDLSQFVKWLFHDGPGGRKLLKDETLHEMFTPQLTSDTNGFGLGFGVGHFRGRKRVSHTGAVYGFTSSLTALPGEKVGVIVLCNDDIAVGPVRMLTDVALTALLGETPEGAAREEAEARDLDEFAGEFESQSFWARIDASAGRLSMNYSGQKLGLTRVGPLHFHANGRVAHDWKIEFHRDANGKVAGFTLGEQKFRRVEPSQVAEPPPGWKRLLGSYGPPFIPLIISIRHGHLYAMTENELDNRLTPVTETVFRMPPGLYTDEYLVFQTDRKGRPHTAVLANIPLRRR